MWNYSPMIKRQYVVKTALKATSVFSTLSDAFPFSMIGRTIYVRTYYRWQWQRDEKPNKYNTEKISNIRVFWRQLQYTATVTTILKHGKCYTKGCGFEKSNHQPQSKTLSHISFITTVLSFSSIRIFYKSHVSLCDPWQKVCSGLLYKTLPQTCSVWTEVCQLKAAESSLML